MDITSFDHQREVLSARAGLLFCATALLALVPLVYGPVITDYRTSDSYRMVAQIDFPAAMRYFHDTTGFGRNELRPLTQLTYAVDNYFWGGRAAGYHLTNLLLHAAGCVLLLLVLYRLTGSLLPAFIAAALYSIHPAHHARVAWIAARDSAVCLLFLLCSWLAYLYRQGRSPTARSVPSDGVARHSRVLAGISWTAYLAALLSYEGAVPFPFVLLVFELAADSRLPWRERAARALRATTPYFALLGVYLIWWLLLFRGKLGGYDLDLGAADVARDFYSMHYRLFHNIQHWQGLLYLAVFWMLWRGRRRHGALIIGALGLLWLGFLPFLPVHGYADRFGFLSAIGVMLLLGVGLHDGWAENGCAESSKVSRRGAPVVALILALILAADYTTATERRIADWNKAGRTAEAMIAGLKATRPSWPSDAALIFDQVPARQGVAYLFPTGFRAALRERYRQPLPDIYYSAEQTDPELEATLRRRGRVLHFRYLPEKARWVELRADPALATRR